jgi:MFS family permease
MSQDKHDPYAALRLSDYRYVLGGLFLIGMTFRCQQVAVGWDIYERTGSAMALGWVGVAMFIPVFLLFLPAGQWADRYSRRSLMMISFALASLASLALAFASWTHASEIWIYLAVAANGAAQTVSRPARFAIIPSVVPAPLVSSAVAWSTMAGNVAFIGGPALAGLMIAESGAISVYAMVFILNLLGFLCVSRIQHRARADTSGAPANLKHLLAGLVHVWKTRVIFAAILLDLVAVLFGGAVALLPIYAKDILDVGPTGLGWLAAGPAIGACICAFIMGHLPSPRKAGATLLWSVAGFGVATIVFGWSTNFWLSLLALVAVGALDNISVVIRLTMVQLNTPDELRGRVSAVNSVFISSSNELGAFRAGAMGHWLGAVPAVVLGGFAILALVALQARMFPELRRLKSLEVPAAVARK